MRLMVAGGGTGGHLYPGLAVAEELERISPGSQVLFIGTRKGIEARIVPAAGHQLRFISIAGYLGKSIIQKLLFPWQLLAALFQSLFHVRCFRPEAMLGTGGYVSAPPVLAAWLLRIPVGLLALDALPSAAVRLMAGCAEEIYAGFPECAQHLRPADKVIFTGNPLRREIGTVSRSDGAAAFGLDPKAVTVLLFGGSRGAHRLNTVIVETVRLRAGEARWQRVQFIIQTGQDDCEWVKSQLASVPVTVRILPYIGNMPHAYAASDLVISRSGAGVSETVACGLPSILIPYPYAANNHQEENARSLQKAGAAAVILEKDLNAEILAHTMEGVLFNERVRLAMGQAARALSKPGASHEIAGRLIALSKKEATIQPLGHQDTKKD
ncbi:MAG: undecaprenyldiphospho-muramoylpentapeptide beta-N-acetylglucosaminyltransferase, partial [Candidatus Edwardsbacteria bacterium]|nr:undecaprenyldiphospho-muramoylpentapeptide beta-N-acetylglucosaminyltransferase [Candidatus Edwardsbacteria bacterium]